MATKISFCNEILELCNSVDVNYENVRKITTLDERIGQSHTAVPGHDGRHGFGGTCFPKDMHGLLAFMNDKNIDSYIIKNALLRNESHDRIDKDWEQNVGRSII